MENKEQLCFSSKVQVYELCKGGTCCPVLVRDGDKVILKDGEIEIELNEEHIKNLYRIFKEQVENLEE
ncbi:MAG: hypothetical protein KatS3mg068_1535 [Candidatus Sericytochromatia bacterium]|nr:MAG: hypothetical protein KatS3mg068_1535 [Candidatus Sericytochromatia bacterium]